MTDRPLGRPVSAPLQRRRRLPPRPLMRGLVRRVAVPVGRVYRRVRTKAQPLEPARLEAAVQARRPAALSLALLVFVVGFSLDDLRVLRLPGYLVGAGLALLFVVLGPMAMGRTFAMSRPTEPLPDFQARAARAQRLARLRLLGAAFVFIGWLVIFSAGVPPWVR